MKENLIEYRTGYPKGNSYIYRFENNRTWCYNRFVNEKHTWHLQPAFHMRFENVEPVTRKLSDLEVSYLSLEFWELSE